MNKHLTYHIWALGCAMNQADAERIATVLDYLGYQKTADEKTADIIIVVACSIKQAGIDRILGKDKIWKLVGHKHRLKILTGCLLEQDRPKMSKIFDVIFDIKDLQKLPEIIKKHI